MADEPFSARLLPMFAAPAPPEHPSVLDDHLSPFLRHRLEQRYWAPIGEAATVERFIDDLALYLAPRPRPRPRSASCAAWPCC